MSLDSSSRSSFGLASAPRGLSDLSLKRLVTWGDHLKVDQQQIDAQHEGIFGIAMEISDLWQRHGDLDQLKAVAEKLARVLEAHFRYEERQLADIVYPKLVEHQAEHKVMLDELQGIRNRLDRMGSGNVQMEPGFLVLSYILGVTVGHIVHSDMDYGAFARASAGSRATWPTA